MPHPKTEFPPQVVDRGLTPPAQHAFNVPYLVREGRITELYHLVEMGDRMHKESSTFRHMNYDYNKVAQLGAAAMHDDSELFLRVIALKENDTAIGMFLARMDTSYFGTDRIAVDLLVMVEQAHRGHCYYQMQELVRDYKGWARERDAKIIWLACSTGIETDKTSMLFASLGFPPVGRLHGLIE